ncbi:MAG: sensor histidine kinase [Rhodospirillaceae bacterium]
MKTASYDMGDGLGQPEPSYGAAKFLGSVLAPILLIAYLAGPETLATVSEATLASCLMMAFLLTVNQPEPASQQPLSPLAYGFPAICLPLVLHLLHHHALLSDGVLFHHHHADEIDSFLLLSSTLLGIVFLASTKWRLTGDQTTLGPIAILSGSLLFCLLGSGLILLDLVPAGFSLSHHGGPVVYGMVLLGPLCLLWAAFRLYRQCPARADRTIEGAALIRRDSMGVIIPALALAGAYLLWFTGEAWPVKTLWGAVLEVGAACLLLSLSIQTSLIDPLRRSRRQLSLAQGRETAARQEADRLRKMVDDAGLLVIEMDTDGRILLINERLCRVLGVAEDLLIGQFWVEQALPRDEWDAHRVVRERLIAGDETLLRETEGPLVDHQKRVRNIRWYNAALRDRWGVIIGIRSAGLDVTALRSHEQSLRDEKVQAEQANRAKSAFLAGMSHALRTPLNTILGFSQMMEAETFGPLANDRYRDYIRTILDSGRHVDGLISDILDVSAIEAGHMELRTDTVALQDLVDSCVHIIGPKAEAGQVTLQSLLIPTPPTILADQRRVMQMLVHLVTNAVTYTPAGGRVSLGWTKDPAGRLGLTITDTGEGMTERTIREALDPFREGQQGLNRAKREETGLGLGLPLTKGLIEAHGGMLEISARQTTGPDGPQGTTATLWFPPDRVLKSALRMAPGVEPGIAPGLSPQTPSGLPNPPQT